jgi:hypothetical protein
MSPTRRYTSGLGRPKALPVTSHNLHDRGQCARRVQGFVEKLWFPKSYLMINAFLYGIYNQSMALPHLSDPEVQASRHKWLEAAFAPGKIEAVVTFGTPAFDA